MIAHFQDAFPDGRTTSEALLAEGDTVAQRWTFRGTHHGAFQGIPPTGRWATPPPQVAVVVVLVLRAGSSALGSRGSALGAAPITLRWGT